MDESLDRKCYLDAIITMVDAMHIQEQLTRQREEGVKNEPAEQLAFADKIILNKIDRMPSMAEREGLKGLLRRYNPLAEIIESKFSRVDPEKLLGLKAFNLENILLQEPDFLEDNGSYIYSDPNHDVSIGSLSVSSEKRISIPLLLEWFQEVLGKYGAKLFRYKGIVNGMGADARFVFQVR